MQETQREQLIGYLELLGFTKKIIRPPALMSGIAVSRQQGHSTLSLPDWVLKLSHKSYVLQHYML